MHVEVVFKYAHIYEEHWTKYEVTGTSPCRYMDHVRLDLGMKS